jgi:hypothetical protein
MSIKEAVGILMRDMPPAWRRVGYFLLAAVAIYRAAPLLAAVLNAPAEVVRVEARVRALEDARLEQARQHQELSSDLARAVCLLEVVTGKRLNPVDCR